MNRALYHSVAFVCIRASSAIECAHKKNRFRKANGSLFCPLTAVALPVGSGLLAGLAHPIRIAYLPNERRHWGAKFWRPFSGHQRRCSPMFRSRWVAGLPGEARR